jgi:hypothetical protein
MMVDRDINDMTALRRSLYIVGIDASNGYEADSMRSSTVAYERLVSPLRLKAHTMITDHFHRSERLVYREIDEDTDLDMFHRLRTDPVVNQWMWPFVCSPWSKKRAAKSLIFDKAIIQ